MPDDQKNKTFIVKFPDISMVTAITHWFVKMIAFAMFHAVLLMLLWNIVIPDIFPFLKSIAYPEALGLILITRLLTRSWMNESRNEMLLNQLTVIQHVNNNICNLMMYLAQRFGTPVRIQHRIDTPQGMLPEKTEIPVTIEEGHLKTNLKDPPTTSRPAPPKAQVTVDKSENFDETG
jgi:hypothetical protein